MEKKPQIFFQRLDQVQDSFREAFLWHEKDMGIEFFPKNISERIQSMSLAELEQKFQTRFLYIMERPELLSTPIDRQVAMNVAQCLRIMNSFSPELQDKINSSSHLFDTFTRILEIQKKLGIVEIWGKNYYWIPEEELQNSIPRSDILIKSIEKDWNHFIYTDKSTGIRFFHPSVLGENFWWLPFNIIRSEFHVGKITIEKLKQELWWGDTVSKKVIINRRESEIFSPLFIWHLKKYLDSMPIGPEDSIGIATIYINHRSLPPRKIEKLLPEYQARFPDEIWLGRSRNWKTTIRISKRVVAIMIKEQHTDKLPPAGWKTPGNIAKLLGCSRNQVEMKLKKLIIQYPEHRKMALGRNGAETPHYSPTLISILRSIFRQANGTYGE